MAVVDDLGSGGTAKGGGVFRRAVGMAQAMMERGFGAGAKAERINARLRRDAGISEAEVERAEAARAPLIR